MKVFTVDLYNHFNLKRTNQSGYLKCYLLDNYESIGINRLHPAMLIFPGGGYKNVSNREAEPLAVSYLPYGYNAFVLDYSVFPVQLPNQLIEAALAVAYIRENCNSMNIDSSHIASIGFSAGGNLLAMLISQSENPILKNLFSNNTSLYLPNAIILSYSVFSKNYLANPNNILSIANNNKDYSNYLEILNNFNNTKIPAYIWCCADDDCVFPQGSINMAKILLQNKIPFELHIFENGGHGISLANNTTSKECNAELRNTHVAKWFSESIEWLALHNFITKG